MIGRLMLCTEASRSEVVTMKKSSYDHVSLKYDPLSQTIPNEIILDTLSKVNAIVKNMSMSLETIWT